MLTCYKPLTYFRINPYLRTWGASKRSSLVDALDETERSPRAESQGSTSCSILPSRMGKHGVSSENMDKMENMILGQLKMEKHQPKCRALADAMQHILECNIYLNTYTQMYTNGACWCDARLFTGCSVTAVKPEAMTSASWSKLQLVQDLIVKAHQACCNWHEAWL